MSTFACSICGLCCPCTNLSVMDGVCTNCYVPVIGISLYSGESNVTGSTITLCSESPTATITAAISPSNATKQEVTWISSNSSVITVSDGTVTAVGEGNGYVQAITDDGSYVATVYFTSNYIPVTSVEICQDDDVCWHCLRSKSLILDIGDTATLDAFVFPSNATNNSVTWKSSDISVITINSSGIVTAVGAGSSLIVAITDDVIESVHVIVTSNSVTGIDLLYNGNNVTNATIPLSTSSPDVILTATVYPSTAINNNVTWTSSNSSVTTVNNGTVSVVGAGSSCIKATTEDGRFIAAVYFNISTKSVPVTGIALFHDGNIATETTKSLSTVDPVTVLTATVYPANATNKNITWSSGNTSVIDATDGIITMTGVGSSFVQAITDDGSHVATVYFNTLISATGISVFQSGNNVTDTTISLSKCCPSIELTATVYPANATNQNISWYSNNPSVISVSNGVITTEGLGTGSIYAITQDGNHSATVYFNVYVETPKALPVIDIDLLYNGNIVTDTTIYLSSTNPTAVLTPMIYPTNTDNETITWESSDTSVITVNNGVVTARGIGMSSVQVTTQNHIATIYFVVVSIPEIEFHSLDITNSVINSDILLSDITEGLTIKYFAGDINIFKLGLANNKIQRRNINDPPFGVIYLTRF